MNVSEKICIFLVVFLALSVPMFAGFPPGPICTLTVTPQSGNAPLDVTANGSCTEAGVPNLTTTIDWGDDSSSPGPTATHNYPSVGTYTVTISATDPQGLLGSASLDVTVLNAPPVCTLTVSPQSGVVPLTVTANGNCTDPNDGISLTNLDWGDGTIDQDTSSGTHTYNSTGIFTVTLTGFDTFEATGTATADVNVTAAPSVFLGVNNGKIIGIRPDGSIAQTLDTTLGGTITGMAFDSEGILYTTDFTAGNLTKFGADGDLIGNFGSGYDCQPESTTIDRDGNVYVGLAGCKKNVLKFDSSGALKASYAVAIEDQGADWIDLSADQCTLFYTSEGSRVLRYNVCGNRQLPDFSSGFHKALAIRLLPDGGVLVADNIDIHRTDATGIITKTYDATGADCLVALSLDPDGQSFWSSDACTSQVYHFDLTTGNVIETIKANSPPNSIFGIAIGGQSSNFQFLDASPPTGTVPSGGSATFTISLGFAERKRSDVRAQLATSSDMLILTCSNLPIGAKCDFSPTSISVSGGTSTLTITTNNTQVTAANFRPNYFRPNVLALIGSFPFALGLMAFRRRAAHKRPLLLALVIGAILILIACGSNSTSVNTGPAPPVGVPQAGTTPPGTYTINVNAGNGPNLTTNTVTLTVQ